MVRRSGKVAVIPGIVRSYPDNARMDIAHFLIDFILHVDKHLAEFVQMYGMWVYGLLFLIVFVETGLVVMPFLPGDSLLFIVGTLCASGAMSLPVAIVVLLIAAYLVVLGTFGLLSEVIIGFGWWRLLARSARIENPQSIATVKASTEDTSLVGQGIADALNVGTY